MAYCMSCGAYIPDGQTKCLACGYDEAAKGREQKKKSDSYAYDVQDENLKEKLEQQRRQQQETNRKWAEQEYARRQQQENSRKWAEEEFHRRQQAREQEAKSYVNQKSSFGNISAGSGNKALAALSYLSVLFALPFLFTPEDKYATYHAKQGLRLFIFGILADFIGGMFSLGWIVSLLRIYFIYKGMSNALNDKKEPLPYIGTLGEK